MEVVLSIKELYAETRAFLEGKAVSGGLESTPSPPAEEEPVPSAGTSEVDSRAGDGRCCLQLDSPQEEEALHGPLSVLGQELQRLLDIHWLGPIAHPTEEVGAQQPKGEVAPGCCNTLLRLASHRKAPAAPTRAASSFA